MRYFIDFRGKKLFCLSAGKGPAIALLHGFLESSAIWKNYIRKLSESFRVIAPDLPGHGNSEAISGVHGMDLMAEAVRHVLNDAGAGPCLILGHSMGGYVALAFAEKYPRKVKGIVLFHSHAGADSPEAVANRDRTIEIVKKDHQGFIRNFIPGLFDPANIGKLSKETEVLQTLALETPKEGIIAALEGMKQRPDRQHVLARSKVPVMFIIGKNDSRIPMEIIMPQTTLPEHSEVLLLDHVGHMGFLEAPAVTFRAVKGFADRFS
jgi:pimeloyl-ACP methyl ester carboxylesterase